MFEVGQVVRALVSAQGLERGREYTVTRVTSQGRGLCSYLVTEVVSAEGEVFATVNASFIFQRVQ